MSITPNELSPKSWAARLGALKSRQVPDTDPRVIECRAALAHYRAHDALGADVVNALSEVSKEELMRVLRGDTEVTA
ncbi:hypothetical protein [Rhodococcus pyridinivorans]|uniref:hypothetical protein n=1 Tax=Rhodococcus pyridinivorans TaxID=103816 RepID=UPI000BA2A083|nr:hypothetical protein [Rhodococcus pyridinivorans]